MGDWIGRQQARKLQSPWYDSVEELQKQPDLTILMNVLATFQGCVPRLWALLENTEILFWNLMDFKSKFSSGSKFQLRHFIGVGSHQSTN